MIVDLFAGAGGWDEAARHLQLGPVAGIELDPLAGATRTAAGHATIRADVAVYPTGPFAGRVTGLIASPPCQPFSVAASHRARGDLLTVAACARGLARGTGTRDLDVTRVADPRAILAAEPVRWVRDLRPAWVALEQVPAVLPLWEAFASIFRGWGYATWAGILDGADYGLGQRRRRAFLTASLSHPVGPPAPTHHDPRRGPRIWGTPWTSMADTIGWGMTSQPAPTVTAGGTASGGPEPWPTRARTLLAAERAAGRWRPRTRAPDGPAGLRPSAADLAMLQGFAPSYPFRGGKGAVVRQIGNAVPPPLAARVLTQAIGMQAVTADDINDDPERLRSQTQPCRADAPGRGAQARASSQKANHTWT